MVTILVADDDKNIRELISVVLKNENFNIKKASNGQQAIDIIENEKIDLAIVDIMMPIKDGYTLTKEIRECCDIPILMVTAKRESYDKLKGFELGIDDYMVKPFDVLELLARVKAMLRRCKMFSSDILNIGDLELNHSEYSLKIKGENVNLASKEFQVLFKMSNFPGKIFTRNELIENIWGIDYMGDNRTVDVHIKRLREKLQKSRSNISINTVRGLGYKLEVGK
ncbi:response regulator transcription factor [Asaccharospora irregularis]|uniref:Heme response regulator HssR n=1 Tax=Asaccharospora irregularis DSM 2635 TaxID=1121321 RepID=A0A1M5LMY7_9FIRM|nr:response regulator transcription factor [Asaccharospora irregularis]SHG66270.1 DNA-binding response regulator, OmpR family, contains REC and winged-helix (wHTH) domain [Asaccharospora irregularis DSM 2635]